VRSLRCRGSPNGAEDVGAAIWDALSTDAEALVRVGVLTQVEDLPIFVDGVAEDITSDLTTRIVFQPLADFTAEMIARFPRFSSGGHSTEVVPRQVWDPNAAGPRRAWSCPSRTAGRSSSSLVTGHAARFW
jgi:hypothetical protein